MLFHPQEGLGGFLVVAERLAVLVERLFLAEPVADVAEMAQGAGQVAFENVAVQIVPSCGCARP